MANQFHLEILKKGVETWNQWRVKNPSIKMDLSDASLNGDDLSGVDLSGVDLSGADLSGADLRWANLRGSEMNGADLGSAVAAETLFVDVNIVKAKNLSSIKHKGPSHLCLCTLRSSGGKIPDDFLVGCGVEPWMIEVSKLFGRNLTAIEIDSILVTKIFQKMTADPIFLGGIFISYSHDNIKFVNVLEKHLKDSGAPVWLDKHKMTAGPLKRQVLDQLRIQDIVLLVLSKDSINSDWVKLELRKARQREKAEGRRILCPISIDDAWKGKDKFGDPRLDDELWQNLKEYYIVDFSEWETDKFDTQFQRLLDGIKKYYYPTPTE